MSSYLLDTNIIIDFLKGKQDVFTILQTIKDKKLFISVITIAEYNYGALRVANSKEAFTQFNHFRKQAHISVVDIDETVVTVFSRLQVQLGKKGRLRPVFDLLIAASCIVHNHVLVTKNFKDFEGIEGLKIYA
jgi:predicted nucleic acid-binding protein